MKDYNKTLWEDNVTLISAERMNNIEEQVDLVTDKLLEVESNLNDNIDALDQACTAITGEKFNSIDERIDSEINRLNHKIEVSMLQQEGRGNYSVSNSIEGKTTNMTIRGKTFQNLIIAGNNSNNFIIDKEVNNESRIYLFNLPFSIKVGKTYVGYIKVNYIENVTYGLRIYGTNPDASGAYAVIAREKGICKFTWDTSTASQVTDRFDKVGIYLDGVDFNQNAKASFSSFMLFEEGTDLSDIDEYFEGIKSFGEEENKISILSSGKNLLKPPSKAITRRQGTINYVLDNDSAYTLNGENATTGGGRHLFMKEFNCKIKNGKKYTMSFEIISGTTNDNPTCAGIILTNIENEKDIPASINASNRNKVSFIANKDMTVYPGINITIGKNYSNYKIRIFLEENEDLTEYEPYIQDKKDVLLKNYGFNEGLRGLNNNAFDELNSNQNLAIKRIEKYIFTGNENIRKSNIYGDVIRFDFKLANLKFASDIICNKFTKGIIGKENFECINVHSLDNLVQIQIKANKLQTPDVEGFKTWLKANSTVIYYELAEPIEVALNKNINLKTFNNKTYISFKNPVPGTSTFKSPVDAKQTLSTLKKENEDIKAILNSILESLKNQEK